MRRRDEERATDERRSAVVLPLAVGLREAEAGHPRPKADLGTLSDSLRIVVGAAFA